MSAVLLIGALILAPVIGGGFGELTSAILEILVLGGVVARLASDRRSAWMRPPGFAALVVFLGLLCLSAFFTECVYASLRSIVCAAACVAAYVLAASVCRDRRAAAAAAWGITAAGLAICAIGIRDYAVGTGGGIRFWKSLLQGGEHWRLFGTFVNPGFFAGFLAIGVPLALALYLAARKGTFALAAGIAVVLETAALLLTGTKFGVVSTAAAVIVFFALAVAAGSLARAHLKRLVFIALVLVPVLVIFSGPVTHRFKEAESGGTQVHSTRFRVFVWRSTINMIRDNLLVGLGPGTYDVAYPRYAVAGPTKYAHQSYLQIGAEAGVPALAAFLAALAAAAWRSLAAVVGGRRTAQTDDRQDRAAEGLGWEDLLPESGRQIVNCGLFAALAASCIRNLVDSDWFVLGIALPFAGLAGVLMGRSGAVTNPVYPTRWWRVGLIIACAIAILLTASFGLGDYFAPDQAEAPADPAGTLTAYYAAATVSPLNPKYHREIGRFEAAVGSDLDLAAKEADAAIRLAPTDASNYHVRGLIALREDDLRGALVWFDKALRFNPKSTQTIYQMAAAYRALGDARGCESSFRRLLEIENSPYEQIRGVPELVDLTYVWAHLYFGDKYSRQKKYTSAIAEYRAAIDRLERWRSNKQILEMQRTTGMLAPDEERRVLEQLRDAYSRLAEAYELVGDRHRARVARQNGRMIRIPE